MKVGLYFGTFNPIHIGHLIIANYIADYTELDEVWFVVSPHNPLKKKNTLLDDIHRLALVREAVEDNPKLKESDIEFKLPQPSYTATTLAYLNEKYPKKEFALIMGEDNLRSFHKWRNQDVILENYKVYVYPRALAMGEEATPTPNEYHNHPSIIFCNDAPVMKISASFIRKAIKEGKDVQYLLTKEVYKYVDEMNFYR